jgi:hypothetical protein
MSGDEFLNDNGYDSMKVVEEVILREAHEIQRFRSKVLIVALSGLITESVIEKGR